MKRLLRLTALLVALVVCTAAAVSAQDEVNLFELRGLAPTKAASTLEAWDVSVDAGLLTKRSPRLDVDLLDGKRHRIEAYKVETRGPGDMAWLGRFKHGGPAILTLKHGFVVGLLFAPDATYELATTRRGQVLKRLDPSSFAPCAHEGAEYGDDGEVFYKDFDLAEAGLAREKVADLYNIDIMTVYTPQARNGAGGTAQIEATAQSAVDVANVALANSETNVRWTLVHTTIVDYSDSGNIQADRNWLRNSPAVQNLRNVHGADMVGMLVENGGGFCGIAFLMGNQNPATFEPNAYQVTARSCAVGNLTYAHEHGHNMGLQHDPANGAPPSQAIYPWSYGHFVNGHYRTVMSYSTQCTQGCVRSPYFSNPDIFYQGAATGIANERDNARTINLVSPFTAEYRNGPLICDQPECND